MFQRKCIYKLKQSKMVHEMSHGRKFPDMLLNKTNYYQKLAIRKEKKTPIC